MYVVSMYGVQGMWRTDGRLEDEGQAKTAHERILAPRAFLRQLFMSDKFQARSDPQNADFQHCERTKPPNKNPLITFVENSLKPTPVNL